MTDTEALITAARRYCQENHTYWATRYTSERTGDDFPYSYTDNDYTLFPRYNVLAAILDQVETLVGQNHLDVMTCQQELVTIGKAANSIFTTGDQNYIARLAMRDERQKFIRFVESLTADDLRAVEPLPYRRRLTDQESKQVRQTLLENWNFKGGYWVPLEDASPKPTVFVMKSTIMESDYDQIRAMVKKHTAGALFAITEDHSDSEIEFSLFNPDCYETIYCDRGYDWIIYGSHESTLAFGGNWLLDFIHQLYANRQDQLNKWQPYD